MKKTILALCLVGYGFAQADDATLRDKANKVFKPIPSKVKEMISDNKITDKKIELGKMLFFDPRLSKGGTISCNSCHNLATGGDDNMGKSIGHKWQKGGRSAPTVLNAVYNVAQFWDGRAEDLKAQAKGPIQAGVEMNNTPSAVEQTLKSMPEYVGKFEAAFENKETSFDNMARAIEAFEATLITPNSPFDKFLAGDDKAMTADQKTGLDLFMTKGCAACHSGVNVGGQAYFPFGLVKRPGAEILPVGDKGRFEVTKTATEEYVFRAAPLRNIALTAPYFHSGEIWSLKEAVSVMATAQLGTELKEDELNKVVSFLKALTGDQPKIVYPILPVETDKTPKPVN